MTLDVLPLTSMLWIIAALAALRIAGPQAVLLVRTAARQDDLWLYRLKNTVIYGTLAATLVRNAAIWVDTVWFEMRYFGGIYDRQYGDLVVAFFIVAGCVLAAYLYQREQSRGHEQEHLQERSVES